MKTAAEWEHVWNHGEMLLPELIQAIINDARAGMVPENEGHVQCDTCYQRGYVDGHRKARDTVGGLVAEDCRALDIDGGKCAKNQHHAPPHQNKEHAWYDAPRGLKDAYELRLLHGALCVTCREPYHFNPWAKCTNASHREAYDLLDARPTASERRQAEWAEALSEDPNWQPSRLVALELLADIQAMRAKP